MINSFIDLFGLVSWIHNSLVRGEVSLRLHASAISAWACRVCNLRCVQGSKSARKDGIPGFFRSHILRQGRPPWIPRSPLRIAWLMWIFGKLGGYVFLFCVSICFFLWTYSSYQTLGSNLPTLCSSHTHINHGQTYPLCDVFKSFTVMTWVKLRLRLADTGRVRGHKLYPHWASLISLKSKTSSYTFLNHTLRWSCFCSMRWYEIWSRVVIKETLFSHFRIPSFTWANRNKMAGRDGHGTWSCLDLTKFDNGLKME